MKPIICIYKQQLRKIRMSSHNVSIEIGRHKNTLRDNIICEFCRSNIEDEYHVFLICPRYQQLQAQYIKKNIWKNHQFINLYRYNVRELCNLID